MNVFTVVLVMILLGIITVIILNVAIAVQSIYSTVLTLAGGSSSSFNAAISPYSFWVTVFVILGFFITFIILVLFERNR